MKRCQADMPGDWYHSVYYHHHSKCDHRWAKQDYIARLQSAAWFERCIWVWLNFMVRNNYRYFCYMCFNGSVFLAATKQLYDWFSPSVCLSVRLSVRPSVRLSVTPISPCSHHRIIMKFSGVITMVKSDVHAKGQGQRSKVKGHRGQHPT